MATDLFKKYYQRVAREGILKAILLALTFGFAALALTAVCSWFFGFREGLWVAIGVFVLVTGALAPLFYRLKFRPTTKAIAKRIDELGLEERVLTMTELENDASYIAMRQREDTEKMLGTVNHMLVKIVVSASLIVAVAACGVFGLGMTAVDSLYYAGVIDSGVALLDKTMEPAPTEYVIKYDIASGTGTIVDPLAAHEAEEKYAEDPLEDLAHLYGQGSTQKNETEIVEGAVEQTLLDGQTGIAVLARPAAGWIFVQWSDGYTLPYRQDTVTEGKVGDMSPNVRGEFILYAVFEELEAPDITETGDADLNGKPGDGDGQEGNGPEGMPSTPGQSAPSGPSGSGEAAGGKDQDRDQIEDGNTYYGDRMDDAKADADNRLGSDDSMDGDMKGWIGDYYGAVGSGGNGNGGNGGSSGNANGGN